MGLRNDPRATWTRHLGDLAWGLRESAPKRASEVARAALLSHEAHVEHVLEHNLVMLDWRYWDHREWIGGLGTCLAIADRTLDLRNWVVERCQPLPLSVWDADTQEDHRMFIAAERMARHWFLVAFHAIPRLKELGRRVDPAAVLSLTETFCDHCRFAEPYVFGHPASTVAAEFAARCAVEFGDASERWLLDLARHPAAGGRILWAVIDQRRLKLGRVGDRGAGPRLEKMLASELGSIASDRFGDGRRCGLDTLEYWGRLWLLLGKIDGAEKAALAILAFPARLVTRAHTILALKLLALVAGKRGLGYPIRDRLRSLYRQFWSVYTPTEERLDREQVDALLEGLPHGLLSTRGCTMRNRPAVSVWRRRGPARLSGTRRSRKHWRRLWNWRFGAHAPRGLLCTGGSASTLANPRSRSGSIEPTRATWWLQPLIVVLIATRQRAVKMLQLDEPLEAIRPRRGIGLDIGGARPRGPVHILLAVQRGQGGSAFFYEPFLEAFDPVLRDQLGVWYTPTEVVRYMVVQVDKALKNALGIPDWLAA